MSEESGEGARCEGEVAGVGGFAVSDGDGVGQRGEFDAVSVVV
ncbi:hypothetical protein F4557_000663 [Actinomadura catellatispora]|uniref:Uncharacterized protein n=1 Tax=Actinomadura livida TaxID=79909 RepID=A0A7W7I874_9ACTN|nr:hypothetical protein [Actinomadura catellatispora]